MPAAYKTSTYVMRSITYKQNLYSVTTEANFVLHESGITLTFPNSKNRPNAFGNKHVVFFVTVQVHTKLVDQELSDNFHAIH